MGLGYLGVVLRVRLQGVYNPELTLRSGSLGVLDSPSLRSNSPADHDTVQKRYGLYPFCPPFSRSAHQRWRQDFGHKTFWQSLKKQVDDIEDLLEGVERRAYELLLASRNALWVLDQKHEQEGEQCGAYDDESFPKLQKIPPACATDVVPGQNHKPAAETCVDDKPLSNPQVKSTTIVLEDIEDPIDVAIREKRVELWEMIWTRLARYCAPARSRYYKERLAVIWACVCRAVWTDPSLMLVAQNYQSAKSLLKDSKLDLPTVERLWNAIKQLYVDDVRAAIGDVLHPIRPKGEYVVVLGMRVHKEPADASLPFHAWGHMTAILPCYSCVRKVCKTVSPFPISILLSTNPRMQVDDIVALTRYTLFSCSTLHQSNLRYHFEYEGFLTLTLCGFIPNDIEDFGPRFRIWKDNAYGKHYKPRWTEVKSNPAIFVGLSLTDPKSQEFLNACLRHPVLQVLCRKGPEGRLIRSRNLCGQRRRTAETRAALKNTPWEGTNLFSDSEVLTQALPVVTLDQRIDDCFQVAIVDDGDGDIHDFVAKLERIWLDVYDVNDPFGLFSELGIPYLESQELEEKEHSCSEPLILLPNTEPDILVSYKRLWKRGPREGRLVDDKINTL